MRFQQLIDALPILGVFVALVLVALSAWEAGYRLGHRLQESSPEEQEGPTSMIVGSLLALMAFLLAITMGMATDRFDTRRATVLAEANSVGTTYLRAGYLPAPSSSEVRELLREYVSLRITPDDLADLPERLARSGEVHAQLWSIAESLARSTPDSPVLALFIDSLNEMIDVHQIRVTAAVYARVPPTILLLLLGGVLLTMGMVGYSAGLTGRRSLLSTIVLIGVLAAVVTLVVDLDRIRDGFLKVSQQPLIDLQEQIRGPFPASPPE